MDELLREAAVAEQLGVTARTLGRWRAAGIGPAWVCLESGLLRYRRADVERYLVDRTRALHRPNIEEAR